MITWIKIAILISFSKDLVVDNIKRCKSESNIGMRIQEGKIYYFKYYIINLL